MPSTYPKCPYCGHEFGHNRDDKSGAWMRAVTCPSCGKRCEVGYKCTMRAMSRKVRGEGEGE